MVRIQLRSGETKSPNRSDLLLAFIFFFLSGTVFAQQWSGILDPTRAIDWSQSGIAGGIPSRTTNCTTINASSCGNGSSDCTSTIQNAMNSCPANQVVALSAGTFRINSSLRIPSNVVLRGAGPDQTILDLHGSGDYAILIGSDGVTPSANTTITGGATKGSTSINVSSTSGISVGKMLVITQTDTSYMTEQGSDGLCNWCNSGINHMGDSGQLALVTSVSGNTVGITPPLYMDYSPNSPYAFPMTVGATNAGVESLQLFANNTGYTTNILLDGSTYSWVANVESNFADGNHVEVWYSLGDVVRDSYFHDGFIHVGGGTDDMLNLAYKATATLVENNIFWRCHTSVMLEWGAAGNVVAYNYSDGNYHNSGSNYLWFIEEVGFHGAHPMFNLFEGNIAGKYEPDDLWGSSSHGTVFRDWYKGSRLYIPPPNARGALQNQNEYWEDQDNQAISIDYLSQYYNLVGTIVGSAHLVTTNGATNMNVSPAGNYGAPMCYAIGYNAGQGGIGPSPNNAYNTIFLHGINNCVNGTITWASGVTHSLPPSFYMSGKPAWWGSMPWPATGPDITGGNGWQGYANLNPAGTCFNAVTSNGTENTGGLFNANNCYATQQGNQPNPPQNLTATVQ